MSKKSVSNPPVPDRWSFLWLALAAVCLVFIWGKWSVSLAGWLAPVFLLRFMRTQKVIWGYLLVLLVLVVTTVITWTGIANPIICGFVGFLASLAFLIDRLLAPRLKGFTATLVLPLAMTALDFFLYNNNPPAGSIGSWAYAQNGNLVLMQLVSITGIWGVTFLTAWFASNVNWAWERSFSWPEIRRGVAVYGGVLLVILAFGSLRLALFTPQAGTVRIHSFIALEQDPETLVPHLTELMKTDMEAFRRATVSMYDPLIEGTVREARAGAQIVVWPEAAAFGSPEDIDALIVRGQQVAQAENIYLAMGLWIVHADSDEPRLVIIDPSGKIVINHLKYGLQQGTPLNEVNLQTVDTPYGRLSGVLCMDLDYPRQINQAGRKGVDILLVPGMEGDPAQAPWHVRFAPFRAVENGFSLVRLDAGGVSIATDPYGRLLAYMDYFITNDRVMVAQVPTHRVPTVYAAVGDLFGWLAVAGFVFIAGWAIFRRRKTSAEAAGSPESQVPSA
jgi:apolipoprotein N-acyltransferase